MDQMLEIVDLAVVGDVVAFGIFIGILVCLILGRWIGRRVIARYGAAGLPSISSLKAAVFALLGFPRTPPGSSPPEAARTGGGSSSVS
jgi:hypothetical protein